MYIQLSTKYKFSMIANDQYSTIVSKVHSNSEKGMQKKIGVGKLSCGTVIRLFTVLQQLTREKREHLTDRSFEFYAHELIHFCTELVWKFVEDVPAKPGNHCSHGFLVVDTSLLEVEQLIFTDLGCTGFMLNTTTRIFYLLTDRTMFNRINYEEKQKIEAIYRLLKSNKPFLRNIENVKQIARYIISHQVSAMFFE